MPVPFHISIPVGDLERARAFYAGLLGCGIGRTAPLRMDVDFFGHHLVAHLAPEEAAHASPGIAGEPYFSPIRHFGVVLPQAEWREIADRLEGARADFVMTPQVIGRGGTAEQSILQVNDTCGNVVEFKSIPPERMFATEPENDKP